MPLDAQHLAAELINYMAKVKMTHIPYKGGNPGLLDVVGGHVDMMASTILTVAPHAKAGRLRALAVTSMQRSSAVPEVPTVSESGYPEFESTSWQGVVVRAGASPEVVAQLNREIVKILNIPEIKSAIEGEGNIVIANSPQQFAEFVRTESKKLGEVIKFAHIE